MKLLVLIACLLLASACAPVIYVTPAAGDGQLLPEQAQRALDAYTATARVVATQAAQATSARQATQDAIAARQTDVALQMTADAGHLALGLTQAAGAALATDAAGVKTQSAQQTAAWTPPKLAVGRPRSRSTAPR